MARSSVSVLAPGFLIASPPLGDPNFDRTVVLLALHGAQGAMGFVVNRTAPMGLAELLAMAGYPGVVGAEGPVFVGGPVHPSSGWVLDLTPPSESPVKEDGVIAIGDRIRISSSRAAFDELVKDAEGRGPGVQDPRRRMVLLGYSGWGEGQLEGEIARGAWLPVPFDEGILFDVPLSERWERAYALLGLSPAGFIGRTVGEA